MAKEIFISYSRKDFDKVKAIKDEIDRELGINCWMDIDGIESGEQFEDVIISAINSHEVFLFMLSPNSMNSVWALDELDFAQMKGKRIVLLFIESCKMTDKFYFRYHKYDTIEWDNTLQHDKLIKDMHEWLGISTNEEKFSTGLEYHYDDESMIAIVNSISDSDTRELFIPDFITKDEKKYKVVSIREWAFNNCDFLTAVTISEGVQIIGEYAFAGCTSLTSVSLPNSLSHIGIGAFYECENLNEVILPENLTCIGKFAFKGCKKISEISIPKNVNHIGVGAFAACTVLEYFEVANDNQYFCAYDGALYNKEKTTLIQFPCFSHFYGRFKIIDGVEEIADYAFMGNNTVNVVFIPDSTRRIGIGCFKDCILTEMTIPDSVLYIDKWAFGDCEGLKELTLSQELVSIGEGAFYGCDELTSVTISQDTIIEPHTFPEDCEIIRQD